MEWIFFRLCITLLHVIDFLSFLFPFVFFSLIVCYFLFWIPVHSFHFIFSRLLSPLSLRLLLQQFFEWHHAWVMGVLWPIFPKPIHWLNEHSSTSHTYFERVSRGQCKLSCYWGKRSCFRCNVNSVVYTRVVCKHTYIYCICHTVFHITLDCSTVCKIFPWQAIPHFCCFAMTPTVVEIKDKIDYSSASSKKIPHIIPNLSCLIYSTFLPRGRYATINLTLFKRKLTIFLVANIT